MNKNIFSAYKPYFLTALLVSSTLILTACDKEPQAQKTPGQALVNVDGEEITMLQLNDELRRTKVQPDQLENAKKQILESMINRQLMLAEAQRNKLDRTPNVMQAIERAKKQILAQAYLQNTLVKIEQPSDVEVNEFFQSNPAFFTEHKLYNLTVLRFASKNINNPLKALLDKKKSPKDVSKWLEKKKIPFLLDQITRSTAKMPPQMSTALKGQKQGDIFLVNENADTLLVSIDTLQAQPISLEQAKSRIETHLLNKKRQEAAKIAIANLRSKAKIDYLHEANKNTGQAATTPTTSAPTTQPISDVDNKPIDELLPNESIESGITGLK